MVYFKFDDMLISSKDFYKNKQAIDIYKINEYDIVVSDPVAVNNGRDKKYLIGYKKENMIIPLLIKTPKDIYCTKGVTQYDENSKYSMSFLLEDHLDWKTKYNLIWSKIEKEIGKSLTVDPIKNECFLNGKIRSYKDEILTNFHKQEVPYDVSCQISSVLCINSVYNQGKNYYPQVYVEECKYKKIERLTCNLLSDSEEEGWETIFS